MSKVQANIVKLAAKGIKIPDSNYDEIVHSRRSDDLYFKSSLFETINLIQDSNFLDKVDIKSRFALANLFHWLGKKKTISNEIAVNIFKQLLPIFTDESHSDHKNLKELVDLFSPTNEEDSFSITVFPFLRRHLNVYDLVEIIRGLDNFFNHVILKHFDEKSGYSIILLNSFIETFEKAFDDEVKSKSEMSFLGSDSGDTVKLSTTEVYRAFLNSIEPIFFKDVNVPDHLVSHINFRFMVETNISHVGELIESTFDRLMYKSNYSA